jgi:hypothetical protein
MHQDIAFRPPTSQLHVDPAQQTQEPYEKVTSIICRLEHAFTLLA